MSLLTRLDAAFRAPAPAERLAMVRILVGAYATIYIAGYFPYFIRLTRFPDGAFSPVGGATFLGSPLPAVVILGLVALTIIVGAGFIVGAYFRVSGPLFAGLFLFVTSYRSSFGMLFHTDNLVALHVLILGLAPAADALSWHGKKKGSDPSYGWPLRLMMWVTALGYFVAGVAKMRNSGWAWISGDVLFSHIGYDALRKIHVGATHSPLGTALLEFPQLATGLSVMSMILEIGAPLFVLRLRWARLWSLGVWSFHVGVLALMFIAFPYPLLGLAYLPCLPVERALERRWVRRIVGRFAKDVSV